MELPKGPGIESYYQIVYADPPWPYRDKRANDPAWGGISYPVMTMAQIRSLPIASITAPNSALFLWVTMPFISEGLEVIKAWGFKYVTCAFAWVKLNPGGVGIYSGLGNWTNSNAELVLFGRRGRLRRLARNVKQIIMTPRRRHSEKPPEIRDRIVALLGDLPRIELFAREKTRDWDVWGNEVDSDIDLIVNETQ